MAKKKQHNETQVPTVTDKLAAYIAARIVAFQRLIVARLKVWDSRSSNRQKKTMLIVFCTLFGGYLLYVLVSVLLQPAPSAGQFLPAPVAIPHLSLPPPVASDTSTAIHGF